MKKVKKSHTRFLFFEKQTKIKFPNVQQTVLLRSQKTPLKSGIKSFKSTNWVLQLNFCEIVLNKSATDCYESSEDIVDWLLW